MQGEVLSFDPPQIADLGEHIAHLQFLVHKRFYAELVELRFPATAGMWADGVGTGAMAGLMAVLGEPIEPTPPKRPKHLLSRLRAYARELFDIELAHHPLQLAPAPLPWTHDLAKRSEATVMQRVREIGNLTFHATYEEMQGAIRGELERTTGQQDPPSGSTNN